MLGQGRAKLKASAIGILVQSAEGSLHGSKRLGRHAMGVLVGSQLDHVIKTILAFDVFDGLPGDVGLDGIQSMLLMNASAHGVNRSFDVCCHVLESVVHPLLRIRARTEKRG